jgi:signal peptidase I
MIESLDCSGSDFFLLGKDVTQTGASLRFEVCGWSMYPLVKDRDVVEVVPAQPSEVSVGDIVLYRSGTRLLAHRVVGRETESEAVYLRARGDSFLNEDPIIAEADLIGRVRTVFRQTRGRQRVIPQDTWLARCAGFLMARSAAVHWLVRSGSRQLRRIRGLRR